MKIFNLNKIDRILYRRTKEPWKSYFHRYAALLEMQRKLEPKWFYIGSTTKLERIKRLKKRLGDIDYYISKLGTIVEE